MAFVALTAAQVDADSPINETLMDLIRTNLDDLDSRISAVTGEGALDAWCNYDGQTNTIMDSFNIASVTDNGTGTFDINWDTDFANTSYAVFGTTQRYNSSTYCTAAVDGAGTSNNLNVGYAPIIVETPTADGTDHKGLYIGAVGDQ